MERCPSFPFLSGDEAWITRVLLTASSPSRTKETKNLTVTSSLVRLERKLLAFKPLSLLTSSLSLAVVSKRTANGNGREDGGTTGNEGDREDETVVSTPNRSPSVQTCR